MTSPQEVVLLFDVDQALLDSDRVAADPWGHPAVALLGVLRDFCRRCCPACPKLPDKWRWVPQRTDGRIHRQQT